MRKSLLGAALAVVACAETPPPGTPQAATQIPLTSSYSPSGPSGSGYSTSDYTGGKGLDVPHRENRTEFTVLVVRPEAYTASFAVRDVRPTPAAALDAAKALSESVAADLRKALGPAASVRMRGLTLSRLVRDDKLLGFTASVDGELRVRLAPDQDFWARSRLYTTLIDSTQTIAESARAPDQAMRTVSFQPPEAVVDDPESHRAELIKRWVAQARGFANAAQAEGAPLVIRDCDPPGSVAQQAVSFDEVSLQLSISCHIDTPAAGRAAVQVRPLPGGEEP